MRNITGTRPVNIPARKCLHCNKRLPVQHQIKWDWSDASNPITYYTGTWYYRNGPYFCTKTCGLLWANSICESVGEGKLEIKEIGEGPTTQQYILLLAETQEVPSV